ncbi:MAG: HD family phosphohydrolase [Planctomycetota bacterium]
MSVGLGGLGLRSPLMATVAFSLFTALACLFSWDSPERIKAGERSRSDRLARVDFEYEDAEATSDARRRAEAVVPPQLRRRPGGQGALADSVSLLVKALIEHDRIEDADPVFIKPWKGLDGPAFSHLSQALSYARSERGTQDMIRERFADLARAMKERYVITPETDAALRSVSEASISSGEGQDEGKIPVTRLWILGAPRSDSRSVVLEVERLTKEQLRYVFDRQDTRSFEIIAQSLTQILVPTLELDPDTFALERAKASSLISPVTRTMLAGEPILPRGRMAQEIHESMDWAERLAFSQAGGRERTLALLRRGLGLVLALALSFVVFLRMASDHRLGLLGSPRRFAAFASMVALVALTARVLEWKGFSPLWIPLPLAGLVWQLVYGRRDSLLAVMFTALVLALGMEAEGVALSLALGTLVFLVMARDIRSRMTPVTAGAVSGVVLLVADLSGFLRAQVVVGAPWEELSRMAGGSVAALVAGLASGVAAAGLLPVVEKAAGVITPITWLELANMNHPLLKKLILEAPGTWQHSMALSTLSEAAAERIGANGLMCRVVCYYHDIGKSLKPMYFIENLASLGLSENPHDKLSPAMSALIILAHPRDGLAMAQEHRLPKPVLDAIVQHHGTTRTEYFYRKALEQSGGEVDEVHYRYGGPVPQNREMGIIMIADSTESAVRTLKDPTPEKIQAMVQRIVQGKIDMGQLAESGLTLTDLKIVVEEFTRVLVSIHHARIEYPPEPGVVRAVG